MDGDWDRTAIPLADDPRYTDIGRLYEGGLEKGRPNSVSHQLSQATLDKLEGLFASVLRHGYLSQRALLKLDREATRRANNDVVHAVLNEIGVNVYRDGSMARTGSGFHRLALAAALGIEAVPVIVRVRHARWQEIRDEIRSARSIEALGADAAVPPEAPGHGECHPSGLGRRPIGADVVRAWESLSVARAARAYRPW